MARPMFACGVAAFLSVSPVALFGVARAEEGTAPSSPSSSAARSLSLEEALRLAKEQSPELRLSRGAVREARARRIGVGKILSNPRIAGDVRPPVTGGTLHDLGYSANVELPFDLGGAPGARVREADRGTQVAESELRLDERRVRSEVWSAYVRAQAATLRISETHAMVSIAERIVAAARERSLRGASGDIDLGMATGELAELHALEEASTRQRNEHVDRLRDLLDLSPTQEITLTSALGDPAPAEAEDALVKRAMNARPEFARIRARIELLEATRDRLSRETFPRIGLYAGVDAAPVSPIFGLVGLSMELPIIQRQAGPRAVVAESRAIEEERLLLQARQVARDVSAARRLYESRRAEFRILTDGALPAAVRTLELVEIGWLAGRFDIFRMTSAARDAARLRTVRLDALEATWLAHVDLDRNVGGQ